MPEREAEGNSSDVVDCSLLIIFYVASNWSHLTHKLPSKASYRRRDKGRDVSDKKTRMKT
jgi:hypothetical protein